MGKLLLQQRRGKGSPAYKCPSHRYKTELSYRRYDEAERSASIRGYVAGFVDDPARSALLMSIVFENRERSLLLAPEGMRMGDEVQAGAKAGISLGSVLPLSVIPDGMPIYNIERAPGDGGTFVRSAGSSGYVVSHEKNAVLISLPSKRTVALSGMCRAQIGVVAGGGRLDRPMMKAGKMFYAARATNRSWPNVRGVAMNAVSHPYGGSQHHAGKSTCTSRNAPPGRKVGHLAARSTGRRKGKLKIGS
ncbi:MAG: 50S ribosomal protein L2 [Candidatus Micrarchaeota archaeon]|nr:50S ribosomal protein L2 [Candidatus Micrarchaeota archaeon]